MGLLLMIKEFLIFTAIFAPVTKGDCKFLLQFFYSLFELINSGRKCKYGFTQRVFFEEFDYTFYHKMVSFVEFVKCVFVNSKIANSTEI